MQIQTSYNRTNVSTDHKIASMHESGIEDMKQTSGDFESLLTTKPKTEVDPPVESKTKKLIQTIEELKGQLDLQLTMDGLLEYKEAVKSFLQHYTQNELSMKHHILRDHRGYSQKVSTISTIDEKMNALTENMLETNSGHLETLKQIGEINGLIVNLYM